MKKKIIKVITATLLLIAMSFSVLACAEIEGKSKLRYGKINIEYYVDGVKTEQQVGFKLYLNYAPATIEHFTHLVEEGYYNNTIVSNLTGYFEFGEYTGSKDALVSKYDNGDYDKIINSEYRAGKTVGSKGTPRYNEYGQIFGEFEANGIGGNRLNFSGGALVLKRNYSENENNSYFNTGKATIAVTFGSASYFYDASKYAVFGKLLDDDELTVNGKKMTSVNFVNSLFNDYKSYTDEADDTTISYYYFGYDYSKYPYAESDAAYEEDEKKDYATINAKLDEYGRYFMKEGNTYYYKTADGYKGIIDADDEDDALLISAFSKKSLYMLNLPYADITIKSIKLDK